MRMRWLVFAVLLSSLLVLAAQCPFIGPDETAANQAPVAQFTATPTSGESPLTVTFSASGSYDPDGSIQLYAWAFGDGLSGSGAQVAHTYSVAVSRSFTATLTVTDNGGATKSTNRTIAVSAPVPTEPTPTPEPTGPCNCSGPDLDCSDFSTHAQAQACYNYCKSLGYGDVFRLDADKDGSACESLP